MAGNLGEFFVGVAVDLTKLQAGMKTAVNQMRSSTDQMVNQTNKSVNAIENRFKRLGDSLKTAGDKMKAVGTGLTALTAPLGLAGIAAVKLGTDAIEAENLFDVSMGNMTAQARQFSKDMKTALGVSEYSSRKYIATLNDMASAMGLAQNDAYDLSTGLTRLVYDLSSFKNLKPEEAFEKITAALTGEVEPMKRLGYVINETAIKNEALRVGIIKQGQDLSEQQKVMIRYNLMLKQTGNAQGDLARTLDSPANKMRILQERVKDLTIDLGMALMPAFDALLNISKPIVKMMESLVQWFSQLSPAVKMTIAVVGALVVAAGPLLFIGGQIAISIGALMPVFTALSSVIMTVVVPAIRAVITAFLSLSAPMQIAIIAITLLWVAWRKNFGNIQDHFAAFKTKILDAIKSWINSVKTMFGGLGKIFQGVFKMMGGNFKEGWKDIAKGGQDVAKGYRDAWTAQIKGVTAGFEEGAGFMVDVAKNTKKEIDSLFKGTKPTVIPTTAATKPGAPVKLPEYKPMAVTPGGLGGIDKTKTEKEGLDAFETAKRLYDMDIIQVDITNAEKLALYKDYLKSVEKTSDEEYEYKKQLKEFEVALKEEEIAKEKAADEAYVSYISGYTEQISALFRKGLDAMLDGTLTFAGALQETWGMLRSMFLDVVTKMFQDWLKAEIAKRAQAMLTTLVMQTQGKSALMALGGVLGAAASALISAVGTVGTTVLGMMGTIGTAIAAIPGAGWIMGGLIIAGVATAIGKISGLMSKANETTTTAIPAFAEGTMEVGQSGLAMVHSGETIIPATSAQKFRENGNTGTQTGPTNVTITALDSKSFERYLDDNSGVLTNAIKKASRYGKL